MSRRSHELLLEKLNKLCAAIRHIAEEIDCGDALWDAEVLLSDYELGCCRYLVSSDLTDSSEYESFARQCEHGIVDVLARVDRCVAEGPAHLAASPGVLRATGWTAEQFATMSSVQVWRNLVAGVTLDAGGWTGSTRASSIAAFDTCPDCGGKTQIRDNNTNAICDECGLNVQIYGVVFDNSQLYNSGGKCTAKRPYKSKPHVEKHIRALLGLTDTEIPVAIIDKVHKLMTAEFSRGGVVRSAAEMTCEQVRKWLRIIKYTKYIEVPKIRKLVAERDGVDLPPEQFTSDELYYVTLDAVTASELFETVTDDKALLVECSKPKIHNRIFYQYMLYRVIEKHIKDPARFRRFVGAIHFQSAPTLLKNDKIWEKMCAKMEGYSYKPSNTYLLLGQ